jgi:hypothetical protein
MPPAKPLTAEPIVLPIEVVGLDTGAIGLLQVVADFAAPFAFLATVFFGADFFAAFLAAFLAGFLAADFFAVFFADFLPFAFIIFFAGFFLPALFFTAFFFFAIIFFSVFLVGLKQK